VYADEPSIGGEYDLAMTRLKPIAYRDRTFADGAGLAKRSGASLAAGLMNLNKKKPAV
jgi:hypothetical protein